MSTAISAPLSLGELVDRITILEIKAGRLISPAKRAAVRRDLQRLQALAAPFDGAQMQGLKRSLLAINRTLWECESLGRRGRIGGVPPNAKRLLSRIQTLNDRRHRLKSAISRLHAEGGFEYKSYA